MSDDRIFVVVPWYDEGQIRRFLSAWGIEIDRALPRWLLLQQDAQREGCAVMKNRGVAHAVSRGADVVVVLDDDCFPHPEASYRGSLETFAREHAEALRPQEVELYAEVTSPPSRGTPYGARTVARPVAASMGFWSEVGDYCAPRQLAFAGAPMRFERRTIYGQYFSLSGMNLAFRPREWHPWCRFIDVPRFDDIWMGWLWQREAYRRGCCFNLRGPIVRHARQSNVWSCLRAEVKHLEVNETLWASIANHTSDAYEELCALLPEDTGGPDR